MPDKKKETAAEAPVAETTPAETAAPAKEEKKAAAKPAGKKLSTEELLGAIEQMTILELNDLVKAMEEKFGITAAAPMAVAAAAPAAGGEAAPAAEAKDTFTVVLKDAGANKINVIKVVRKFNAALGLKEAKDLVEAAPKPVVENVKKDEAEKMKKEFEEAGAKIELQ